MDMQPSQNSILRHTQESMEQHRNYQPIQSRIKDDKSTLNKQYTTNM